MAKVKKVNALWLCGVLTADAVEQAEPRAICAGNAETQHSTVLCSGRLVGVLIRCSALSENR